MYDKKLANSILLKLQEAFPLKVQIPELRNALPEFSDLSLEEWLISADALIQLGYADGRVLRGFGDVPADIASLQITNAGRQSLGQEKSSSAEESGDFDDLLPIFARRQFDKDFTMFSSAADASGPLGLMIIDLDKFKSVNDSFGHPIGDQVLLGTASGVKSVCKGKGRCYRWGGDELVVLIPNYSANEARALAERVREVVSLVEFQGYPEKVTLSIGIACYPGTSPSVSQLLADADHALLAAKNGGRDRVCVATGSADAPIPKADERLSQTEVNWRVEKVRLWIKLVNGTADNFLLNVENKSEEEIDVEEVRLESGGYSITEQAFPFTFGLWKVLPKCSLPLAWRCDTDPAMSLIRMNDHKGLVFKADLRVVLVCRVLDQMKEFEQKIPVQVYATNNKIISLL